MDINHFFNELFSFIGVIAILSCVFYFIERIKPVHKSLPFFKADFWKELYIATINIALTPIMSFITAVTVIALITPFIPYQMFSDTIAPLPLAVQILLGLLIIDFSVYWRHRFSHFGLWSFHSIHHSAKELTWTTKLRLHPIDVLAATIFDTLILHILGFGGSAIMMATLVLNIIDFLAHTNINLKYPKPLRYILASPHSHRWHHANVREAYDKNFCAVFPFYDIMFGTFYHPEELPPEYGLSKIEERNYPYNSFTGWLAYPFKREYKRLQRKLKKP